MGRRRYRVMDQRRQSPSGGRKRSVLLVFADNIRDICLLYNTPHYFTPLSILKQCRSPRNPSSHALAMGILLTLLCYHSSKTGPPSVPGPSGPSHLSASENANGDCNQRNSWEVDFMRCSPIVFLRSHLRTIHTHSTWAVFFVVVLLVVLFLFSSSPSALLSLSFLVVKNAIERR